MPGLRLYLLGPPRLERDGLPLEFDTRKNLALVAYLAMTGQSHTREALITLLWPELEPSRARAGLRRNLSVIKKALGGEWLVVDRETVGSDPDADFWLDVDQVRRLTSTWRSHPHPEAEFCSDCMTDLAQAVELYRDHFLAGFGLRDSANFDEWQFFEVEELKQMLASALERLVRGHTTQRAYELAIPYARRWLALDPLYELAHRELMTLYAKAGQRSAALRQYQECVRILEEELGLEPSDETNSLHEDIRSGGLDPGAVVRPRHNLPAQLTPFVGREEELSEIQSQLKDPDCRLLTLVGPGGIGKTRLALRAAELASEVQPPRFEHGISFVRLGPLRSVDAIVPAVADAVNFRFYEGGEPKQQLLDYLKQKRMLLLMDNFEHLLEGIELVTEFLQSAPDLMVLVTSRVGLNLRGEHLFPVEGMDTPKPEVLEAAPEYDSVKLFIQRAHQTRIGSRWTPTSEELMATIRICRLVEGMPLGILMAAGWMELLKPAEIAAEIERGLDFLSTNLRDVPARQRSMRAVFDHSWSLLTESERDQFQQLSVFRGGFSREAAQKVAGTSLIHLRTLLDKSFVESGPAGRYEMHELLRQYGEEALGRSPEGGDAARDRHSAYFAERLASWGIDLKGERQQGAMEEIEADLDNVRAAWGWAAEHGPLARIAMAVDGLFLFYQYSRLSKEGVAACRATERFLKRTPSADGRRVWAKMLAYQAGLGWFIHDWDLIRELLQQSNAILESPELVAHDIRPEKAITLFTMGYAAEQMMEKDRLFQESLAISRELGDDWEVARALIGLARGTRRMGDYKRASQLIGESLAILQSLGDPRELAEALHIQANLALRQGQYERGEHLLRETISAQEKLGQSEAVTSRAALGTACAAQGRFQQGISLLRESVRELEDFGAEEQGHWWRIWLADCLTEQGEYSSARLEAERAHEFYQRTGRPWGTAQALYVMARAALGTGAHAEARQQLEEASAKLRGVGNRETLAWTLTYLAYPAAGLGDLAAAQATLTEGLALASEVGALDALVSGVPALALLRARQGQVEQAIELYAVALTNPRVANSKWFYDLVGAEIAAVAAALPPEVVAAIEERGRTRDLDATIAELVAELGDGPAGEE